MQNPPSRHDNHNSALVLEAGNLDWNGGMVERMLMSKSVGKLLEFSNMLTDCMSMSDSNIALSFQAGMHRLF